MKPKESIGARELWERSFEEQISRQAFNTAPVEALVRNISYYLRDRFSTEDCRRLHFLELGCGTGPNLVWLAEKGIRVSGVDHSPTALALARRQLESRGLKDRLGDLLETSVTSVALPSQSFDGVIEACVFQHLGKQDRQQTFAEVKRLLKPGGLFVGYMLDAGHTVFQKKQADQVPDDPGSLVLKEGGSNIYLTNLGLSHFFKRDEIVDLLQGFSVVDPCLTTYWLPKEESNKRGYPEYLQSMWAVYAIR